MFGSSVRRCTSSAVRAFSARSVAIRPLQSFTLSSRLTSNATPIVRRAFTQSSFLRAQAEAYDHDQEHTTVVPGENEEQASTFQELVDRKHIHPALAEALITDMKLETMTDVQAQTMNASLTGRDIVGQAKTGTGKTLAFLLPIVQRILREDPQLALRRSTVRPRANDIRGLIISPTRELAEQIATEAVKLCRHTGIRVQIAVGGTQKNLALKQMQAQGCHLLVGTPGRINDILSDQYSGVTTPHLNTLVLDEADRLLDQGFMPAIQEIQSRLPQAGERERQTMMLSATISHEVVDLVRQTLRPGFKFVQCVDPNEEPTHQRVPQKVVVTPGYSSAILAVHELVNRELQAWRDGNIARPFKAIIFYNSGVETILTAQSFKTLQGRFRSLYQNVSIEQIHSKLSQAQRTRAAQEFRHAESGILLSTDVTARGMDFPNVTHVIQVGTPAHGGRESYIHRLGRTARAGKEGEGWLIVPGHERAFAERTLRNLPLQQDTTLQSSQVSLDEATDIPAELAEMVSCLKDSAKYADSDTIGSIYLTYIRNIPGNNRNVQPIVDSLNAMTRTLWGLESPPRVPPALLRNAPHLKFAEGLNISHRSSGFGGNDGPGGFGGSSFGGRSGGGGGFGGGERRSGGFRDDSRGGGFGSDRRSGGGYGGDRRGGGGYGGDRQSSGGSGYGGDRRGGDRRGGGAPRGFDNGY